LGLGGGPLNLRYIVAWSHVGSHACDHCFCIRELNSNIPLREPASNDAWSGGLEISVAYWVRDKGREACGGTPGIFQRQSTAATPECAGATENEVTAFPRDTLFSAFRIGYDDRKLNVASHLFNPLSKKKKKRRGGFEPPCAPLYRGGRPTGQPTQGDKALLLLLRAEGQRSHPAQNQIGASQGRAEDGNHFRVLLDHLAVRPQRNSAGYEGQPIHHQRTAFEYFADNLEDGIHFHTSWVEWENKKLLLSNLNDTLSNASVHDIDDRRCGFVVDNPASDIRVY
jgi:hypothetical protein